MYSLYRAWFGDESTGENYPHLQESLSPPDTVVRVGNEGEHQFVAHKGVLAAHSGYLKALLSSVAANPGACVSGSLDSTSTSAGMGGRQPITSVSVSSIGGEAFAPLLNYMYTGRLEVTLDNVYSVLLATHLLHMPGALEQCRAALLRLRAPPPLPTPLTIATSSSSTAGSILRPIPNRLMVGPPLCWPQTAPIYPSAVPSSVALAHLPQLQPTGVLLPPSIASDISATSTAHRQKESAMRYSSITSEIRSPKSSPSRQNIRPEHNTKLRSDSRSTTPESGCSVSLPFVAHATTFNAFASRASSPCASAISKCSSLSRSPSPSRREKKIDQKRAATTTAAAAATATTTTTKSRAYRRRANDEVSVDASPSRVAEEESTAKSTASSSTSETERARSSKRKGRSTGNVNNDGSSSGVLSVVYDVACCDGPVRFHRVLNENYVISQARLQQKHCLEEAARSASENDENGGPGAAARVRSGCTDQHTSSTDSANSSGSYTCGYCRHTFKSQYCYRKHAKRHLLPTRSSGQDAIADRNRQESARARREVRLLDLNVQYYPCKICGCKFPSYYFVHKHRKLCHANMEENSRSSNAETSGNAEDEASSNQRIDATP